MFWGDSMIKILIALILGVLLGILIKFNEKFKNFNNKFQLMGLVFLLFSMGASIGADDNVIKNLPVIGFKAVFFAALTIAFSIIFVFFITEVVIENKKPWKNVFDKEKTINFKSYEKSETIHNEKLIKDEKKDNTMTIIIITSVVVGIWCGSTIFPVSVMYFIDSVASWSLLALIFSVGIDIGGNKRIFKGLKKVGLKILLVPLCGVVGSALGSIFVGLIFNLAPNESLAIGAGYGWYSLSGVLLKEIAGETIGAIAFLSNVFRELFAVILIPIVAKKLNEYTAIAPAGAASMDTLLPLISRETSTEIVIVSFINGVVLSTLVPIIVPFFYNLKF